MQNDIEHIVRAADNVYEHTSFPLNAQQEQARQKRRIGLGHMGLGSLLMMMKIPYGSQLARDWTRLLQETVANLAYQASAQIAEEKEPAPAFDYEKYSQGELFQDLWPQTKRMIKEKGLRNTHLLSIQPTGNTSILAGNVSGGLEPVFSSSYIRTAEQPRLPEAIRGDVGWEEEKQGDETVLRCTEDGYEQWIKHPTRGICKDELVYDYGRLMLEDKGEWDEDAEWAKTAMDLTVDEHVGIMEVIAPMIDAGMSKTINVPNDYPYDDFKGLYKRLYESGTIKGGTTYRIGTMSTVLREEDQDEEEVKDETTCPSCGSSNVVHEEGCETCRDCGWSACSL
jgi:ribonucleoside-diphosphate reductase alpha chain